MDSLDPQTRERIGAILADLSAKPGPLLLVLHEVQRVLGHVPPAAVPLIAQTLNLSRAEVHGVIGFYHYFRTTPGGRHRVQICRAESCQAMQGEALAAHAERILGVAFHETTPDGAFSLEPGVLPGQLRVLARRDDRRGIARPRYARAVRGADRRAARPALMDYA